MRGAPDTPRPPWFRLRLQMDDPARPRAADRDRFRAGVGQGTVDEPHEQLVPGTSDLLLLRRAYTVNLEALRAMSGVLDGVGAEIDPLGDEAAASEAPARGRRP